MSDDNELRAYAAAAYDNHCKYVSACRKGLRFAQIAGQALNQARAKVGWGGWGEWLRENFRCASQDTAENYMKIDREWARLEPLLNKHPNMSINEALRMIKEPGRAQRAKRGSAAAAVAGGGAAAGPEPAGARVVVPVTPEEEARKAVMKRVREWLDNMSNDVLVYLHKHGLDDMFGYHLIHARYEVEGLFRIIWAGRRNRDRILCELDEVPEEERNDDWRRRREKESDRSFRLGILRELKNVNRLTGWQQGEVLDALGVDWVDWDNSKAGLAPAVKGLPPGWRAKFLDRLWNLVRPEPRPEAEAAEEEDGEAA